MPTIVTGLDLVPLVERARSTMLETAETVWVRGQKGGFSGSPARHAHERIWARCPQQGQQLLDEAFVQPPPTPTSSIAVFGSNPKTAIGVGWGWEIALNRSIVVPAGVHPGGDYE